MLIYKGYPRGYKHVEALYTSIRVLCVIWQVHETMLYKPAYMHAEAYTEHRRRYMLLRVSNIHARACMTEGIISEP